MLGCLGISTGYEYQKALWENATTSSKRKSKSKKKKKKALEVLPTLSIDRRQAYFLLHRLS